ncbi:MULTISPECIES: PPOX class F420-dependent oxidoreductase [Nocardia]|uniref:PPOX class F420-dependent oxidoreductase n=1 Tax=Nocardia TaxID=1817 RepID=UPI000D69189D|nr:MULTISPECIES: PPOX class F420-dependent oxidoreductase [Nocardia]
MIAPTRALAPDVTTDLSEGLKKYLDESTVFATAATISPTGEPHLTVVWIERDGDDLLFSTTRTRAQGRNIVRDPRVTILVSPPDNPYVYAEIRGTATVTDDPERVLPNRLSRKYTGQDYADFNPSAPDDSAERIIVRITPTKVVSRL